VNIAKDRAAFLRFNEDGVPFPLFSLGFEGGPLRELLKDRGADLIG